MSAIHKSGTFGLLVWVCLIGGLAAGCGPSARIIADSSQTIRYDPQRILVHASLFQAENKSLDAFNESLRSRLSQCGVRSAFAVSYKVPNIPAGFYGMAAGRMATGTTVYPHKPGIFYDHDEVIRLRPDALLRIDARSAHYTPSRSTTYIDVRVSRVPSDDPLWTPSSMFISSPNDPLFPALAWKGEGSLSTGTNYMTNPQEMGDAWAKEILGSLAKAGILDRCASQPAAR